MQLFITPFDVEDHQYVIQDERVVHQLAHVLRSKIGEHILLQHTQGDKTYRVECEIIEITKKSISCVVVKKDIYDVKKNNNILCVAMPNKSEKIELIVQKCTEIGLSQLIFFVAERSQIREMNKNKIERVEKIMLEAAEQSFSKSLMNISFKDNVGFLPNNSDICVFRHDGENISTMLKSIGEKEKYFFVGPEGGRGTQDDTFFEKHNEQKISLGEKNLRTETASIVVAWELIK